jgi:anti-sigma regulatory factor (Ser/Thr protein kinase)
MNISHFDVKIEIPLDATKLAVIRQFINVLALDVGFSYQEALQVEMCVDEACANSIEGTLKNQQSTSIQSVFVSITIEHPELHIVIQDGGEDFTRQFQNAEPLSEVTDRYKKRGYGLQIIKKFMDEVSYVHDPEQGNFLHVVKKISVNGD